MKTFKFSLVLRSRENTDVFITLDDTVYGIRSKRVNTLYLLDGPHFLVGSASDCRSRYRKFESRLGHITRKIVEIDHEIIFTVNHAPLSNCTNTD